jgi:hypothetical protein
MTLKWMKEHAIKISVGFIVIVILMMFAIPCICDHAPVIKSATCVGTSCMHDSAGGTISGMTSATKSMMESVKQKLLR